MWLQRLATMLDQYGLAQDLLDEKYQASATIQANLQHIGEVLEHFFANVPQEDTWRAGQENGWPWRGDNLPWLALAYLPARPPHRRTQRGDFLRSTGVQKAELSLLAESGVI